METKLTGMWQYRRRLGMALLIGVTAVSTMAWAAPVPLPSGTTITPSESGFSFSYPGGTVVDSLVDQSFNSFSGISGGSWTEIVVQDPTTHDLDFYIQITLGTTSVSNEALEIAAFSELTGENYNYTKSIGDDITSGMPTGVTTPSSGPGVYVYPQSASSNSAGTTVDFNNFTNSSGLLTSGDTSAVLAIFTTAPSTTLGTLTLSGNDTGGDTFSESTNDIYVPVPEPVTLLFGLAIVCVIGVHLIRRTDLQSLWPAGRSLTV